MESAFGLIIIQLVTARNLVIYLKKNLIGNTIARSRVKQRE